MLDCTGLRNIHREVGVQSLSAWGSWQYYSQKAGSWGAALEPFPSHSLLASSLPCHGEPQRARSEQVCGGDEDSAVFCVCGAKSGLTYQQSAVLFLPLGQMLACGL